MSATPAPPESGARMSNIVMIGSGSVQLPTLAQAKQSAAHVPKSVVEGGGFDTEAPLAHLLPPRSVPRRRPASAVTRGVGQQKVHRRNVWSRVALCRRIIILLRCLLALLRHGGVGVLMCSGVSLGCWGTWMLRHQQVKVLCGDVRLWR